MSQGLRVYKDDKKNYMKKVFLPVGIEKEKENSKLFILQLMFY
jgi:hypothetical protein